MLNKNKKFSRRSIDGVAGPIKDIKYQKAASSFPGVGATMSSYSKRPKQDHGYQSNSSQKSPLKNQRRLLSLKWVILTLLIIILAVGVWVGGKFIYDAHKLFGGNIFSVLHTTTLTGESTGRVNILLAGNSADDPGHNGANLTDSILIMSIDTKNNTAFLLSVPRDLWVNIPGNGYDKINDAYVVGQTNNFNQTGYFPGGMGQLQQIVQQDFGITIDYYALINYAALKDAVNTVGGISIDIQSSDPRGIYDPSIDYTTHMALAKYTNGIHVLDGQQALDLARARGDAYGSYGFPDSDFDRTEHQRQMLVALKQKAETVGVLSNPAALTGLADALSNNVKDNFTLSEIHRLLDLVKPISSSSVQSLSLNNANGKDLLSNFTSLDGEDALIPAAGIDNYSQIQEFVNQQVSTNPLEREAATVEVLNGTETSGLATSEETALSKDGLDVVGVGNSSSPETQTTIIDNSAGKMPQTLQFLKTKFGNNNTTTNPYVYTYSADFIIILGNNAISNPNSSN
jgi:LCP family protein required for cell wall assembly